MDSKCLGKGKYSTAISCDLKRGHMPHIANRIVKGIPCIKGISDTMYISSMKKGTVATYKFFDLSEANSFIIKGKGKGIVTLIVNKIEAGKLFSIVPLGTNAPLILLSEMKNVLLR